MECLNDISLNTKDLIGDIYLNGKRQNVLLKSTFAMHKELWVSQDALSNKCGQDSYREWFNNLPCNIKGSVLNIKLLRRERTQADIADIKKKKALMKL